MSSLKINVPHQLSREEAITRIKKLLEKVKTEHSNQVKNVKEEWQDNQANFEFSAQGFDLSGTIQVNDNSVDIDGNLPFALSFFKGKISSMISEKATQLLSN